MIEHEKEWESMHAAHRAAINNPCFGTVECLNAAWFALLNAKMNSAHQAHNVLIEQLAQSSFLPQSVRGTEHAERKQNG